MKTEKVNDANEKRFTPLTVEQSARLIGGLTPIRKTEDRDMLEDGCTPNYGKIIAVLIGL